MDEVEAPIRAERASVLLLSPAAQETTVSGYVHCMRPHGLCLEGSSHSATLAVECWKGTRDKFL